MSAVLRAVIGSGALFLLGACAGSGDGLDESGRPLEPGAGSGVLTPDLASIQAHVFTPICVPCHVGAGAPQGLRLDAASSHGALVGVPSSEVPALLRVRPGDPGNSYLIHKLEGRAAVGARMPLDQPALPAATIQVIRQWITDGAMPVSKTPDASLKVANIDATPARIAIALTRSPDASLVHRMAVTLEHVVVSDPVPAPVPLLVTVSPHNEALLVLRPREPLSPGVYRLTLRGDGPAALADWNARALDGDMDDVPGGDFVALLTIGIGR